MWGDNVLLGKRAVIEPVNDIFKNICQEEHRRYRRMVNFPASLPAALSAYSFCPINRPSVVSVMKGLYRSSLNIFIKPTLYEIILSPNLSY
jgi:hypothetical protein